MTLYEITNQFRTLDTFEINGPEDAEAFTALAAEVQASLEEKAEAIVRLTRNWEAEQEALRTEEKALAAKRQALENKTDRLKAYLLREMEGLGEDKIKAGLWTVSIATNPPKLVMDDMNAIPSQFWVPKLELDKAAVKEAALAGTVEGAHIERGRSLRVR